MLVKQCREVNLLLQVIVAGTAVSGRSKGRLRRHEKTRHTRVWLKAVMGEDVSATLGKFGLSSTRETWSHWAQSDGVPTTDPSERG